MTPVTGMGPTCCVHHCLRPVWAAGGYCVQHYMGLSAAQRAALEWEEPTVDLTDALNALLALDAKDFPESEAA